jgi:hypothetical protein
VALTWAAAATFGPAARAAPPVPAVVLKAEPAPEWDRKFAGKQGWVGGDEAYSAVLGPGRILWLFGDSLLGTVRDGGRPGAAMVNNTVAVQAGRGKDAAIRFVAGKAKDGKPAALLTPADGPGWLWPQAAVRAGDRLFLFLQQIDRTSDPGVFGFKPIGQWLAVVENPDDDPEAWRVKQRKVLFAEFTPGRERSWGSAVLAGGTHLYVYGYQQRGKGLGRRRLTVARVPADQLADFEAWRFRTQEGWSDRASEAAALADGMATECSVSAVPGGKGYVAVYTENGLGDRIVGRFADAPEGPWSTPLLLFRCPEMSKDRGVFCYAAKAHPWAATGNDLLVSYCTNTWDFGRLFKDAAVYRPLFVRVTLGPEK